MTETRKYCCEAISYSALFYSETLFVSFIIRVGCLFFVELKYNSMAFVFFRDFLVQLCHPFPQSIKSHIPLDTLSHSCYFATLVKSHSHIQAEISTMKLLYTVSALLVVFTNVYAQVTTLSTSTGFSISYETPPVIPHTVSYTNVYTITLENGELSTSTGSLGQSKSDE